MFTGIVRELGTVEAVEEGGGAVRLSVRAPEAAARTEIGGSVSVSGVCLTAVAVDDGVLGFDAVPETLRRSSLGRLEPGDSVNVEPALRAGEPLGGHIVQGHVDGVGRVRRADDEGLEIEAPDEILRYCVEKGSITVEGVSLTVADARGGELRRRADPAHARGDDARRRRRGRRAQPRGRRDRQARRAAGAAGMRLEPLYRITFSYRERHGADDELLLLAEGRCEGRLAGSFRAANRARRDGRVWLPDLHGAVETEDGAAVLLHLAGRGRPEVEPAGRVVGAVTHVTEDARYTWLNETVGAIAGEVYRGDRVVLDVSELVWEPLGEAPGYDPEER